MRLSPPEPGLLRVRQPRRYGLCFFLPKLKCSFSSSGVPKTQGCSFSKLKCSFFNKHQFRVKKSANQALHGSTGANWSRKGSKRRRISGRAGVLHFWRNWLCQRLAVSIDSAADCGEYGHSLPHGETQERASSAEIKLKRVRQFRNVYITLVKLATNLCFSGWGGLSRITDEAAYGLSQWVITVVQCLFTSPLKDAERTQGSPAVKFLSFYTGSKSI